MALVPADNVLDSTGGPNHAAVVWRGQREVLAVNFQLYSRYHLNVGSGTWNGYVTANRQRHFAAS